MDALDGNAIGGLLIEIFGAEMTTATAVCAHCGAVALIAELVVYLEAPGTVARCRTCDSVLLVVVDVRGTKCVDLRGLASLEAAG
jgi:phage FluMu protein Com